MFNPDRLVGDVLRGVLGGKRKRSKKALRYLTGRGGGLFSNPNTLLGAAGVAWGIFETLQNQGTGGQWGGGATSGAGLGTAAAGSQPLAPSAAVPPPLPSVQGASAIPADALRLVRLAIAAASADGTFGDVERAAVLEHAKAAGAEHLVEHEIQNRRPIAEVVGGVTDPAQRATLYVFAFGIVRSDEGVTGSERIFLAQLANQLALGPEAVRKLEEEASARIDAQGDAEAKPEI